MPGLTPIHSNPNTIVVRHDSAADFLDATFPTLRRHEGSANIVLAHALKLLGSEAALTGCHFINESDVRRWWSASNSMKVSHGQVHSCAQKTEPFWLTVWSSPSPFVQPTLDLVLACVNWTLGDYPIFLWTPRSPAQLSSSWLVPRVELVTDELAHLVPRERVFSVFGMTPIVKMFSKFWSDITGLSIEPEPFYAASYTYCTLGTFIEHDGPLPVGHNIRRATADDLEGVAQLCKEFADDSIYFPMSIESGRVEARELIAKGCIWIYEADCEVTTICAVTRSTQTVSAITKVYTTPRWRRRGFAEHLVRDVTRRLLLDCGKSTVTLYVGHANSAQRVYDRVGFVGLCGKDKPHGVEDALELGFVTGAPRGHW
ncbi:hypothetical protein FA95DRAFT_1606743 [Auriscalpium vulgare]|uniref:Uncharacterized protein n=1 Tax=Auriscalpium vulgare TaxID=40419 RepID=A0ACB8RRI0_9AGAM|nr:hypothetical protein FA95DRAFT_1606743 [Auriscalpium vulgare]